MKLITETIEDIEIITEAKENGGKDYKIRGIFMQADIKNRNGRVYPIATLSKEVARYTTEYINKKRVYHTAYLIRIITFFLSVILFGSLIIHDAYAYIDPGSSSMFIQVIVGALVGLGIAIKIYWEKIKFKLFSKYKKIKDED